MKEKGKEKGDVCVFILSFPSLWPYNGQKVEQLLYTKLHKFVGTTTTKNMSSERNQIQTPSFYSTLVGKQFNWVYIHTSTVKRQLNFIMGKLSNIFYSIGLNRQIR